MRSAHLVLLLAAVAVAGEAPGELPDLRFNAAAGYGPDPVLPAPDRSLLPVIDIAPAVGWDSGEQPVPAAGFQVQLFGAGLDHPRWLHVLPNGDVLVAETNAPPRPGDGRGIRGWVQRKVQARAGAAVPSADRITLLRDADGDGHAEERTVFLRDLHSPFGMALAGDTLYVANTDAIVAFRYRTGDLSLTGEGRRVAALPAGDINHHWTKNVVAGADGRRLYVTVGSNSNVGENGPGNEERRAAILEVDPATGATRVYASGLRNPNGLDFHPATGQLWTVVNERDELGDLLVPDYLTSVADGAFYGWPFSYYGATVDARVKPANPERVAAAVKPDYALGAHTASLGLAFYTGDLFPGRYQGGAFVGQHGSWNRRGLAGYRVIFVPFAAGRPAGMPELVLGGFVDDEGRARGRPVGVAVDRRGGLLVADDVGNRVWRVVPAVSRSTDQPSSGS